MFMSAEVGSIAKAKAMQIAIEKTFGVRPEMDIKSDRVVLYYPVSKMLAAQKAFKDILNAPEGDVSFNYAPIVAPVIIQKYFLPVALIAGALVVSGVILGRKKKR